MQSPWKYSRQYEECRSPGRRSAPAAGRSAECSPAALGRDATDDPTPESASESDLVECPNCHAVEEPTASVCQFCDEPIRTPDGPERGSPDDVESPG